MPNIKLFGVDIKYKIKKTYKINKYIKDGYLQRLIYADQIKKDIKFELLDAKPSGIIYIYSLENSVNNIFGHCHKTLYIGETHSQTKNVGGRFKHHIATPDDKSSNATVTYAYNNGYDIVLDVYVLDGMDRKDIEKQMIKNYSLHNGFRPLGNGKS